MPTFVAARHAMGTVIELALVGSDLGQLRAVAEEALDEVAWLDHRWSAFRPESEVSGLNRRAVSGPVRVEPRLLDLLQRARALGHETAGALDPAIGALMAVWGFRGGGPCVPTPEALARARASSGMDNVRLDPVGSTVRYLVEGVQLDLGAIGKGAALDAAIEVCRSAGVQVGFIHAGTSTAFGFGQTAPGEDWRVGIPCPEAARAGCRAADLDSTEGAPKGHSLSEDADAGEASGVARHGALEDPHRLERALPANPMLGEVRLQDQALAVSAVWGRSLVRPEATWGHVLDPRTGYPIDHTIMAAVLAPSGLEADAFSTALLVGGEALQARLAESRPGWRSLVVSRDPGNGQTTVVNCGLL